MFRMNYIFLSTTSGRSISCFRRVETTFCPQTTQWRVVDWPPVGTTLSAERRTRAAGTGEAAASSAAWARVPKRGAQGPSEGLAWESEAPAFTTWPDQFGARRRLCCETRNAAREPEGERSASAEAARPSGRPQIGAGVSRRRAGKRRTTKRGATAWAPLGAAVQFARRFGRCREPVGETFGCEASKAGQQTYATEKAQYPTTGW